jgi:hypothetical protein
MKLSKQEIEMQA